MQKKIGVILVGHGSKERYNMDAIKYFAVKLKPKYPYVGYAFIQINGPSLKEALSEAVGAGVDEIVIQPVFLTRGVHVDQDIPKIIGIPSGARSSEMEFGTKRVRVLLSDPIGPDDRILDILSDRIREALRA